MATYIRIKQTLVSDIPTTQIKIGDLLHMLKCLCPKVVSLASLNLSGSSRTKKDSTQDDKKPKKVNRKGGIYI